MADDMISAGEFGRFRADFSGWLDRHERATADGFSGIHSRLDELNGRTRSNSESVTALGVRIEQLEPISASVQAIQQHGCAQLAAHRALLPSAEAIEKVPGWTYRKKVVASGGLVVVGGAVAELIDIVYRHFATVQHIIK